MAHIQTKQFEELIDQALKNNFRPLEEFLLNETREGITSKCSHQLFAKLDRLINRELDQRNVKNASVVFTIFHKLGNTLLIPEGTGISLMVSQGLVKKWFVKVKKLWVEAGPTRNKLLVNLAEDFFDALMAIHQSCKEGTFQITESLLHHIGRLASDPQINIIIQKEAVRKLNMILGIIPLELKKEKKILSSQEASSVMNDLANRILKGGDYDLQVALMEALCRMTTYAHRRELADQWFKMEFVASAFTKVQDSEFETDCRKFLNIVNGMQGDGRSVYSYPCLEVFLDKHVLLMPVDGNLHEFWIDFNLGSQSISFYFCLADDKEKESQWDTLCITENEVHSYTVEVKKDIKVLQLVLTEPVCLSSIEGTRLHIHFSSSLDILEATKKVYGETKNKKFIGKTNTSVVKTTVQIILDESGSQVLFPDSQSSSQHVERTIPTLVKNDTHCRPLTSHERDAHHNRQQMIIPLRSKVSESCMYVSGSAGRKLGRSPFSCALPASAAGKATVKPAPEMIASSKTRKAFALNDLLSAKFSHSLQSFSMETKSTRKQHIPVEKVVEMVEADQELQEEALDNSIVLDSQPVVWKETSILPTDSSFYKERNSVSGPLFPYQYEPSNKSRSEPPQQSLLSHSSFAELTHKQLRVQLTQRLEQVLKEREQNPQDVIAPGNKAEFKKRLIQTEHGAAQESGWTKDNRADTSNNTRTEKAATNLVKQINGHYNPTAISSAAQENVSMFDIAQTNRYIFNKSWFPDSVSTVTANTPGLLKPSSECHAYPSRKPKNLNRDIYAFNLDVPELIEKRTTRSFDISGIQRSSSKKYPPMKPAGHNVKKYLFSDTDIDNMTEISWINSANRKPKPKVAYYKRQPVKPSHLPTTFTFETPIISIPSPKSAKALPKPKRKRQRKAVEKKNKTTKDFASRNPTNRPKRMSVMTRSYKELSGSESESPTDGPPSAKKFIVKQAEKSQRTASVQKRDAIVKPVVKKKHQLGSKKAHKPVKEKQENELSYGKSQQKKMIAVVHRSTKGQENVLETPFCPNTPSNVTKSIDKSITMLRSTPVRPMPKKYQAIVQEGNIYGIIEKDERENTQPGNHSTHSVTSGKVLQGKEASELLSSEQSKNRKILHSPVYQRIVNESCASKNTSFCLSPFFIEKMRSAEKNASLNRSPLTRLQPCISPVGAIYPPLELPSHLRGIQASSFSKCSGGRYTDKDLLHPFVTPGAQLESAQLNAELSPEQAFLQPLIASTGRQKCPSLLHTPHQDEDLSGFLNSTSQSVLQTCFDKESIISVVTLSQSSHTSMNNISTICTELEKTPASVQGSRVEKAVSGPATGRSSCNSVGLSEQDDTEDGDKSIKAGPRELAVRIKPRKLFKPTDNQQSKLKGAIQSKHVDSSSEEVEKEKGSEMEVRSTMVSSCLKANMEANMDLDQSERSTTQEMSYVCHQFSSELKRKFENRSRRMDLFTKQTLKSCKQHVSTVTMKVQDLRSQRLEAVKQVLMDEIKNLEQDDTSLRHMEAELTAYWKKQALFFQNYQKQGTQRLNHLRSTVEANLCQNLNYEEQIFCSQMQLMKKDMKSVQDHLFRQMHGEELQNIRRGLQTLFLSDVPIETSWRK